MEEDVEQLLLDHEVLWHGVVKIDPSISTHMPEATESSNGLKVFTVTDSSFPYEDNAQLDNPDLVADFPNNISIYVTGGKILEYMKCSVIKRYKVADNEQKVSFFRRKQQHVNDYSPKRIVAAKGFMLSPVNINKDHINNTGCLASVKVSNENGESIIFENTGLFIFASGSKTSDLTFTDQRRSTTAIFVASDEKPLIAYMRLKVTMFKIMCDSSGIKTERTLAMEDMGKAPHGRQIEDPLQILKVRLAKGEISVEEYGKLRRLIADDDGEKNLGQSSNWI
jgi:hypothetical protein